MKRMRLSSIQTIVWKWLFPLTWSIGWGFGTVDFLLHGGPINVNGVSQDAPEGFGALMIAAWIIGTAGSFAFGSLFKRVRATSEFLYVSNYLREIRIPLTDIVRVYQPPYWRGVAMIELRQPTPFGSRVRFMSRGYARWETELPAVVELQRLIEKRRGEVIGEPAVSENARSPASRTLVP